MLICILLPASAAPSEPQKAVPEKTVIQLTASYRTPLLDSKNTWKSYAAGGLCLELPTYLDNLWVRIALDGGQISSKAPYDIDVLMFHGILGAAYHFGLWHPSLALRPFIALSNTTVCRRNQSRLISKDMFSTSESEFGAVGGVEPAFTIGRVRIGVPVYGEYVFTAPIPFVSYSISLNAGFIF